MVISDPGYRSRIEKEAEGHALLTSSYIEGLRWIADPEVPISGIYFDPQDSTYSGLRFLGIAMVQRPATPIFLLNQDSDLSNENLNTLTHEFKIQGVFKGINSYQDLVNPLRRDLPDVLKPAGTRTIQRSSHTGFIALPISDFVYSSHYPFSVFIEDQQRSLKFYAAEGSEVDLEYLTRVKEKAQWLYLEESSLQKRKSSFHSIQAHYLKSEYLSPSWRSAETLFRARTLLNELKKGGISEVTLNHTYSILEEHHERMDRTGYPSALGGVQVQPMAEILSMINSHLDEKTGERGVEWELHYSERLVKAFKKVLAAL